MDCDLDAGPIKFLLKLGNSSSIVDAVEHAPNLDEDLWSQMVGRWDKLDVLHAGELSPPTNLDLSGLHMVLSLARAQYEAICADLGSSLDHFSVELMRESRKVFVVTTPEVVPLYLAAQRVRALKELGLSDKVSLLLNRKSSRREGMSDADVERAIFKGSPVSNDSLLGRSILNLARSLTPHPEPKETSKPRKFLEFFRVPPAEGQEEIWRG
jgi:MinD-like ATPase involved in chromosome partitioning or flagellar assembly